MKILKAIATFLKTYWIIVTALVFIVGGLISVKTYIEKKAIDKVRNEQIERIRWSKIDYLIASDSVKNRKIDELLSNVQKLLTVNNNLKAYMIDNAESIDEMKERLRIWEVDVKKNDNSLYPTVLKQNE